MPGLREVVSYLLDLGVTRIEFTHDAVVWYHGGGFVRAL